MTTTTAGQIIDSVLDRLAESRTSPVFWSRAELLTIVNDGFLEFTLIAGQLISERTYTMISAKLQSVPVGAIALIHVAYQNKVIEKDSVEHFDRANPNWAAQSGILQKWAPCGLDRWFVDRHPTSATNVTLTTLDDPGVLTEGSVIDLEQEYIDGVNEYAFHFSRFKESGAELEQAMDNYSLFLEKSGMHQSQTWAEQWLLYSRDPNANTGEDYSTLNRS